MKPMILVGGHRPGWASWSTTLAFVGLGLLWLFRPLLWSLSAPTAEAAQKESIFIILAATFGLAVLAVALWKDSGWELGSLGIGLAAAGTNAVVRSLFNTGLGGEFNYAIPFAVGAVAGGPLGFFVGAVSCVVSQFSIGQVSEALPGQLLVWGLAGLLGGALRPLHRYLAWVLAIPLGVLFGVVAGVLLNLIGWPTDLAAVPRFMPGAPFGVNLAGLVSFSTGSSLGIDLLRGISTAGGLLVLLPIVRALLGPVFPSDPVTRTSILADRSDDFSEDVARRERARALNPWQKETNVENTRTN